MSLTSFNNGKTLINLDEVRLVNGSKVIFKNDPRVYDIGDESATALAEEFASQMSQPSHKSQWESK